MVRPARAWFIGSRPTRAARLSGRDVRYARLELRHAPRIRSSAGSSSSDRLIASLSLCSPSPRPGSRFGTLGRGRLLGGLELDRSSVAARILANGSPRAGDSRPVGRRQPSLWVLLLGLEAGCAVEPEALEAPRCWALEVVPPRLNSGAVVIGPARRSIELRNPGPLECVVYDRRVCEGGAAPEPSGPALLEAPVVIPPNSVELVTVDLTVLGLGCPEGCSAAWVFEDGDGSELGRLEVEAAPPAGTSVLVAPSRLDFLNGGVGCESTRSFLVYSTGADPLSLEGPAEAPPGFSVAAELPVELPPGTSHVVEVTYRPAVEGEVEGLVRLPSRETRPGRCGNAKETIQSSVEILVRGRAGQGGAPCP